MTQWNVNTHQITDYLARMVSIDSVNPGLSPGGAGEAEIAAWLAQICRALGLEVDVQETAPGRPNVIARWRGSGGGKSLLLTGHIDTVGVEGMEIEPFTPTIKDGRLYGRGAMDMKGGLASILGAVAALRAGHFQPAGDLILGLVADEEYHSLGTNALVETVTADAAILAEPTNMKICTAHRGFAWLTITTEGRATHGSLYDEGIDAILSMRHVLNVLDLMEREIMPQHSHPLLGRPSVHASLIDGGLGWSTYPDRCTLRVEHRLLPGEKPEDVLALWQDHLRPLMEADPQFQVTVELAFERSGLEVQHDAPVVQMLDSVYREITGEEPEYMGLRAWLDSAVLADAGIPTVIFGPGGAGLHSAVEYANLDEVFRCAAILAGAAARWAGAGE